MPLKFGFQRPPSGDGGVVGNVFDHFRSLDLPYNEFPSLHIALALILLETYWRRTRGVMRGTMALWFTLIFLSPIFTYQHHLIDIAGGTILGALCLHLIQEEPLRRPFVRNAAVWRLYAVAGIAAGALAFVCVPYTLALLWPALSLGLVAAGYLFWGPGIYRKREGRLGMTTWILLAPVLLGQWVSLFYYRKRSGAFDRVTADILIGRRLNHRQAQELMALGVSAVLDLTAEFSEERHLRRAAYLQLPILDLTAPTAAQLQEAIAFIELHTRGPMMSGAPGMPRRAVYVHCKVGYSRTAAVVGAYLRSTGMDVPQVMAKLREARPGIMIRPEALRMIECAGTTKLKTQNAELET
jgi:protein-tyrosine phosphatase